MYATHNYQWGPLAIVVAALILGLGVAVNRRREYPVVWWSRTALTTFFVLTAIVQADKNNGRRSTATAIVLGMHLLFSLYACYIWYYPTYAQV